jgi:uncharacterized protein YndB with AHSA1/START domain
MTLQPIEHEIVVETPADYAFELFADQLGEWWPLAFTFSGAQLESAQIESKPGGRWFERTRSGKELSWGEVRAYERGKRLLLAFAIGADRQPAAPQNASEVEVTFTPVDATRTRLTVEHRDFERHGEHAQQMRDGMDSQSGGWPVILAEFQRYARSKPLRQFGTRG